MILGQHENKSFERAVLINTLMVQNDTAITVWLTFLPDERHVVSGRKS